MRRLALGAVLAALAVPASASASSWPNACRVILCDVPTVTWASTANWVIVDEPVVVHHRRHRHHHRPEAEDGD